MLFELALFHYESVSLTKCKEAPASGTRKEAESYEHSDVLTGTKQDTAKYGKRGTVYNTTFAPEFIHNPASSKDSEERSSLEAIVNSVTV